MPTELKKTTWMRICSSRSKGMARIPFSALAPSTLNQLKWLRCCCSSALTLYTKTTSWFSRWTIASRSRLWFQSLLYYLKSCKPGNAATSASANTRRTINTALRTKNFFRACAKHWRWCRQEGLSDPRSADIPRRLQNCGQTIFRKCVDGDDEDCRVAARMVGAATITVIVQEMVTGIKGFDALLALDFIKTSKLQSLSTAW